MPRDVKNEWMDEPLPEAKTLDEISVERQQASDDAALIPPPAEPLPAPDIEPAPELPKPDPISDKDLAKLLEDSAKALLDAAHNIDKSSTNLKKILAKLNFSGDRDVQGKIDTIVSGMSDIKEKVQAMSEAITGYRENKISDKSDIL